MQVNGPKDEALGWDAGNWRRHEDNVRRLRGRIFKAAQEQDLAQLRSVQITPEPPTGYPTAP
jgi:RNA-directed DNA polymerase